MTELLAQSLGPAPFRFTPSSAPLRSASFSLPFKVLATAMVWGAVIWLARLWLGSGAGPAPGSAVLAWFAAGAALMLYTWWHIVAGHTSVDGEALRQSWVWDKKMELRELAYGKLIRMRGLDWLIAPRLYVRTLTGKFAVFYACDPGMLADFERLIRELAEFRRM